MIGVLTRGNRMGENSSPLGTPTDEAPKSAISRHLKDHYYRIYGSDAFIGAAHSS